METAFTVISCVIFSLIIATHSASVFIKSKLGTVMAYVNIALHIALLPFMLYLEVGIELIALAFSVSAAVYLGVAYLERVLAQRHTPDGRGTGDDV